MHALAATFFKSQYLVIQRDEAEQIDEALFNVLSNYDLPEIDPMIMDWVALAQVLGMVYGTRYMAWRNDQRAKAAKNVTPQPTADTSEPSTQPHPPREGPQKQKVWIENVGEVEIDAPGSVQ